MTVRIPCPIPEPDRARLIAAGKHAVEALNQNLPDTWRSRHAKVEKVIAEIQAKFGIEEPEEMK